MMVRQNDKREDGITQESAKIARDRTPPHTHTATAHLMLVYAHVSCLLLVTFLQCSHRKQFLWKIIPSASPFSIAYTLLSQKKHLSATPSVDFRSLAFDSGDFPPKGFLAAGVAGAGAVLALAACFNSFLAALSEAFFDVVSFLNRFFHDFFHDGFASIPPSFSFQAEGGAVGCFSGGGAS